MTENITYREGHVIQEMSPRDQARLYQKIMSRHEGSWDYTTFRDAHPQLAVYIRLILEWGGVVPRDTIHRHYLPRSIWAWCVEDDWDQTSGFGEYANKILAGGLPVPVERGEVMTGDMADTRKCYCDDAEHEMCYDNIIGMYDDACSCCKETSQESEVDA